MATLDQLMQECFETGSVKTASRRGDEDDDLAALAAELGANFDFGKQASDEEDDDEEEEEEEEEKKSSFQGGASLYAQIYPDEAAHLNKQASHDKTAAYQHEMGRATYRAYEAHLDQLIEKTAADIITGAIAIESPKGTKNNGNPHMDATHPQQFATDKPKNSGDRIDLTPVYTDEVAPINDERTVGHYEAVVDKDVQKVASLALRKQYLLANLED